MPDDDFFIDLPPPVPVQSPSELAKPPLLDEHGRFAKGNPGGPGNPHANLQKLNRQALLRVVDQKVTAELGCLALEIARNPKARDADRLRAVQLLLTFGVGKPDQRHEVDVRHTTAVAGPIDLDVSDVAALEKIRAKLTAQQDSAAAEIVVPATTDTLRLLSDAET